MMKNQNDWESIAQSWRNTAKEWRIKYHLARNERDALVWQLDNANREIEHLDADRHALDAEVKRPCADCKSMGVQVTILTEVCDHLTVENERLRLINVSAMGRK